MKTKEKVEELFDSGMSYDEIAEELDISTGTVGYHIRDLGKGPGRQKTWDELYDWEEVQDYYDNGHTWAEVKEKFGMANATLVKAVNNNAFETKGKYGKNGAVAKRTLQKMRYDGRKGDPYAKIRVYARKKIEKSEFEKECIKCGWDHHADVCHIKDISDFSDDTLIEEINSFTNLTLLCPNCHWLFDNSDELQKVRPLAVE